MTANNGRRPIVSSLTHCAYLTVAVVLVSACSGSRAASKPGAQAHFGNADASVIMTALVSPDQHIRSKILSTEIANAADLSNSAPLPAGSTIAIDVASFSVNASGVATVNATVTGPSPGRWRLYLVHEAGQWKILGTGHLG